ncbi:MAG TPA: MOSC domain-containing protein [Roseiflexaceae bacterium]|nr:MOSC domain-containing protein [Roseiflexaceae bacterium]
MITIHTQLIGRPATHHDERGSWRSAIFRTVVEGPQQLLETGLAGDQVADTENHGSPAQAVCCHPLDHYAFWNTEYQLEAAGRPIGPGGVGENWTIAGATEEDVCIGDRFDVGSACVEVSGPRYPCIKQERKLQLPGLLQRTIATRRTGWYLRVIRPGSVSAGDAWRQVGQPNPGLTIARVNLGMHQEFDRLLALELLDVPELSAGWKRILQFKLRGE